MQCRVFSPGIPSSCILPSKAVETAKKSAPVGKTPGLGKYRRPRCPCTFVNRFHFLSKYHDLFLWAVCSAAKMVPFKTSAAVRTKLCNMTAIHEGLAKCRALSHFLPRREHHYTYSSNSHVYSRSLRKRILGKNCSAVPVSRLRSS